MTDGGPVLVPEPSSHGCDGRFPGLPADAPIRRMSVRLAERVGLDDPAPALPPNHALTAAEVQPLIPKLIG